MIALSESLFINGVNGFFPSLGSPKAIEIAKKNIPAALGKLDEFIAKAADLDGSAINAFSCNAAKLFNIVGPEAAQFVKRKAEVEIQLSKLYEGQNKLWDEYVESKGTPFTNSS